MSNENKKAQIIDLEIEQKSSEIIPNNETNLKTPLLPEESKSDPPPNQTNLLKIQLKSTYSDKSHLKPYPNQPNTPQKNLIDNCSNFIMFSPKRRSHSQEQSIMFSLESYPSNLADDDNEQPAIKQDEILNWVEEHYPTTSCGAAILRILRFFRMACLILPVLSMLGSLFTHTAYINFAIEKGAAIWALIPTVESDSSLAETLGGITIGLAALIAMVLILRFLWSKLIKKKFLTNHAVRLKKVRAETFGLFLFTDMIATEMKNLGIIGNESQALLKKYNVTSHTFEDCCTLYYKYLLLAQRYNYDRMGPYDIAKERQVSQSRLSSIFFLLVLGIDSYRNKQSDTFLGKKINYGVIYNIILGLLEDAAIRSTSNHKKSKCFSWFKRKTKSHYALMLQRLVEDQKDKHDDSLEMYTDCCQNSLLFKKVIMSAEAHEDYVEDEDKIRVLVWRVKHGTVVL